MATAAERRPKSASEERQHRRAFGLALDIDPRIGVCGLAGQGRVSSTEPQTRVRLDPEGVRWRWSGLEASPLRTRELYANGAPLLTVDFANPAGYLLWAKGVGRMLISPDGREVLCDPEPSSSGWASILTEQALPLAATLRGFEVLHASGVVLGGKAMLIAGGPGAGKSSLAAALILRGASLLSDDVVALKRRGSTLTAHPGSDALALRPSERNRLSKEDRDELDSADAAVDPAHFGQLFVLERSGLDPAIERLDPVDPSTLLATTFNLSVRTPERLARHLDLAAALAATDRIYRLRVQPGIDATRLAELLDAYLAATSP